MVYLEQDLFRLHGFPAFRDGQKESIKHILEKKDTLAILPTSTGKSLIYFMTTLYYRRLYSSKFVIVCSPLISLMKDQVSNTPSYLKSAMLGSGQTDSNVESAIWKNVYDIVYVSPERLRKMVSPKLQEFISLLVVDEAHCVSEDGSTYRPSYLDIGQIRSECLPDVPILALTATATEKTKRDICNLLRLRVPKVVQVGMDRPNLHYTFVPREQKNLELQVLKFRPLTGRSIIYCSTRKECLVLAVALTSVGWSSECYHAGLSMENREHILNKFMQSKFTCIVATISFGLGVNIPDIRLVMNIGISRSIFAFLQETGRAGRDGKPSRCVLLYHNNDLQRYLHIADTPHERSALVTMDKLIHTPGCRRKNILSFFQPSTLSTYAPSEKCMGCDVCDGVSTSVTASSSTSKRYDIPSSHKTLLRDAILQTGNYHGMYFPILYLRGSNQKTIKPYITMNNSKYTSVHGKGKLHSKIYWKNVHTEMENNGEITPKYTQGGHRVYSIPL